ncbi:hypothetical protein PCANC_02429 [Puccinia coronata f. sp. avenae]|uniref:Uncharacterized protein n=1 Tax=Puccinia coronata f. sp. avenae TaxID=200324 RepID=A0A2N5W4T0_9BASI|nr:hypothetical protein PCANC_02429 [Puccinia coronata f. sp. avenae]
MRTTPPSLQPRRRISTQIAIWAYFHVHAKQLHALPVMTGFFLLVLLPLGHPPTPATQFNRKPGPLPLALTERPASPIS